MENNSEVGAMTKAECIAALITLIHRYAQHKSIPDLDKRVDAIIDPFLVQYRSTPELPSEGAKKRMELDKALGDATADINTPTVDLVRARVRRS
jgi:hypothetical protein